MEELEKILNTITHPNKRKAKWEAVNQLEQCIATLPRMFGEVTERGTPGLYTREIFMPAGMLCTSRIHKVKHQFIVSKGSCTVYNTLDDTTTLLTAPYHGITEIGTRRVLYIHEDCVWTTTHPTDRINFDFDDLNSIEKQVIFDQIMGDIIQSYYNPLIENFDEGVLV
jgi:hypothetical protein